MRRADPRRPDTLVIEPHERGNLRVFKYPDTDFTYVVCADIAEGKAIEGIVEEKSKYDFSCAHVLRVTNEEPFVRQDAVWHGSCDPDEFGGILVALSMLYNNALLGWEVNGPGQSLKFQIVNLLKYRNIYIRPVEDTITGKKTTKPGWRTDKKTKPRMVSTGIGFVRRGDILIRDEQTLAEMKAYSRIDANKFAAAVGHDDRVMALLQGLAIIEEHFASIISKAAKAENKKKEAKTPSFLKKRNKKKKRNRILGSEA